MNELERARTTLGTGPGDSRRALQRARLLGRRPASSRTRWLLAGGLVAAGVALLLVMTHATPPTAHDAQGPSVAGAPISGPLRFSEGSEVVLGEGSVGRLDVLDSSQVELTLEQGQLDAAVTKGTGRTGRDHAGQWVVRVVGTKLHIEFAPGSATLLVSVSEGAVEVSGPGGLTLVRAGESLRRTTALQPALAPEQPTPPAPAPPPAPGPVPAPVRTPRPPPPPAVTPVAARATWQALLRAGQRRDALDEAEAVGATKSPDSDADALLLSDAARLEGRLEVARALLSRVSARRGPDAAEAAFLLGRLEHDAHRGSAAKEAFEGSLALSAQGPFAEQSRGRLLEVLLELDDRAGARAVAHDYLTHHPAGAWAGLARKAAGGAP
jgi:hypothetical protein